MSFSFFLPKVELLIISLKLLIACTCGSWVVSVLTGRTALAFNSVIISSGVGS